jgi:hypothetical protein
MNAGAPDDGLEAVEGLRIPRAAPDVSLGQEAEEPDFTRRDRLDRPEDGVRRRVDANLMELAELTGGNEIIQPETFPAEDRLPLRKEYLE